jgi:hypothetical protein
VRLQPRRLGFGSPSLLESNSNLRCTITAPDHFDPGDRCRASTATRPAATRKMHLPSSPRSGRNRAHAGALGFGNNARPARSESEFRVSGRREGFGQAAMCDDTGSTLQAARRTNAVAAAASYARELLIIIHAIVSCIHAKVHIPLKLSHLRILACVLVVSGCAGSAPHVEMKSDPVHTPAQMCHIDRALLMAVHAPDCGFGRADLKTVDPEQWAHLKLEFERKCYQNAEKVARERLRRFQAAARCEVQTAQR